MKNFPIILDDNDLPYAVINSAFDVYINDQVINDTNGQETLEFKLPYNSKYRDILNNEDHILCFGRKFVLRLTDDDKETTFISTFTCEALWYDIYDGEPFQQTEMLTKDAKYVMDAILMDSEWTTGTVEPTVQRTFKTGEIMSKLEAIRKLPLVYDGELQFDTTNKKVNLLNRVGKDTEILICYEKNMDSIKRIIDSRNLVTRVYLEGKDGLDIKKVNDGHEYVEDYSYFDKIGKPRVVKSVIKKDERFSNPNSLKDYGMSVLKEFSWPKVSYQVKVNLLGMIPDLGDSVIVYDRELGIRGYMRVLKRKINILNPEESEIELDNVLKNLSDQMAENTLMDDTSSVVDSDTLNDVSVFNLLFNSRGDDGFNYWINHGFTIDNTAGVSGKGAFICAGQLGIEQYIEQEVDVCNRNDYIVSAQVEIENLVKGPEGQLGFEVTLEYEDGTTDVQFIAIG